MGIVKITNFFYFLLIFSVVLLFFSNVFANEKNAIPEDARIIGSLGIMKFIVIPVDEEKNIEYHKKIISALCPKNKTCFLRVFTNSHKKPEILPLDDQILNEPIMMFQRSAKHRNEIIQWSCRLKLALKNCFN